MRIAWLTDIHLEFLDDSARTQFFQQVRDASPDAVLISGDIAQAASIVRLLVNLSQKVLLPIYFVLGNHDYYHGSIEDVRTRVGKLSTQSSNLHWLNSTGIVKLSPNTCLVGHDGWGDARLGDFQTSDVCLNDFLLISELSRLSKEDLQAELHKLGDEAAAHFRNVLPKALDVATHVVVLTHVPPFLESSWYDGQYCAPNWLPFFSCRAVGDVLIEVMRQYPTKKMTVLCGHTHGGGISQILPNLTTITGSAQYRKPVIQDVFEWE